jgi:ribokinase
MREREHDVLVACLGDVMLDVVADLEHPLATDDDTPAAITIGAGGQAANVATWVTALGGRARVLGPRGTDGAGRLVADALSRHGVELFGTATADTGVVVSMVAAGTRSMASDPGDVGWLAGIRAGSWMEGADWLFISGYALLRSPSPERLVLVAAEARAQGTRVAVDLASAAMASRFGAEAFGSLCRSLQPAVVFGNEAEQAIVGQVAGAALVLKRGPAGACFVTDGVRLERPPDAGAVVDVTGAGDALAAGYLLGGPDLAMEAAGRCVARHGAQPEPAP